MVNWNNLEYLVVDETGWVGWDHDEGLNGHLSELIVVGDEPSLRKSGAARGDPTKGRWLVSCRAQTKGCVYSRVDIRAVDILELNLPLFLRLILPDGEELTLEAGRKGAVDGNFVGVLCILLDNLPLAEVSSASFQGYKRRGRNAHG